MGFLEFMLGKRLLEDDLQRGLKAAASSPKVAARRTEKAAQDFLKTALGELDVAGGKWKSAGEVTLLLSGDIHLPELPDQPGILRLELRGPDPSDLVVMLSEHQSLRSEEAQDSDEDIASELLAGVRFVSSFIDCVQTDGGSLDLTSNVNRASVVKSIEKKAERSGYWVLQPIGDRNALVPNPEAVR